MSNFDFIFYIVCFGLFILWIVDKIKSNKLNKKLNNASPKVGMPDKDKIEILLALFAIRCSEISYFYSMINKYQKEAADTNWLEAFVENTLFISSMDVLGEVSETKQLKNKQDAKAIAEERFSYDHFIGSLSNSEIIKLVFIAYHNGVYSSDRLRGIKSYGFFENTIQLLVDEYDVFKSVSSDSFMRPKFYNLFERNRAFQSDENINKIWKMILLALKSSLRMLQSRKENAFDIEKILKEIDALESLEWKLENTLGKRNYKDRYYNTEKEEKIIQKVWKKSPFIKVY